MIFRLLSGKFRLVLIVPLWNWNMHLNISQSLSVRFNRTFMELKWESSHICIEDLKGFNRTFMELKLFDISRIRNMDTF